MTNPRLSKLFAEGTAPDRDTAFAARVASEIGRARFAMRLAFIIPVTAALALAIGAFFTGRTIAPSLAGLAENLPEFMGVPAPLVICALIIGLLFRATQYLRLHLT